MLLPSRGFSKSMIVVLYAMSAIAKTKSIMVTVLFIYKYYRRYNYDSLNYGVRYN